MMHLATEAGGELLAGSEKVLATDAVLVAEDSPVYRALLESCLRRWGFKVKIAEDGMEAWEILQQTGAPNLLIVDWMMPRLDGIELCRRIRERNVVPYPYVLLLTAQDEKQHVIDGLNAGADDYLTKPFDPNELQARLRPGMRILRLQEALLRKEEQLRFDALHDSLTGLWNRGAILGLLESEWARARRSAQPVGVVMIDVDHFKAINDNYGHVTGDAVLKEVGRRLAGCIRQYDWAGRYGGEEFLVIFSNCPLDEIHKFAERLREAVASEPVRVPASEVAVTVSAGGTVATPGSTLNCDAIVRAADEALYGAKENGRNRIEIFVPTDHRDLKTCETEASDRSR